MPTQLQKKTFSIAAEQKLKNKPVIMKECILEAGGSLHTANKPKSITESKGWQEILASIDDEPLITKLIEIALSTDKRAATAAIKEILTLKDRYPAQKNKIIGLFDKISTIQDDTKSD